jgi:hypothetical protein
MVHCDRHALCRPPNISCMHARPRSQREAQVTPFPNDGIVGCAVPNAIAAVPLLAITRERYCRPVGLEVEPISVGAVPSVSFP